LLLKNSEVRRRKRKASLAAARLTTTSSSRSRSRSRSSKDEDEEEEEEGDSQSSLGLGDRDPVTGILYTRGELKKMLRAKSTDEEEEEEDEEAAVKERSGDTPLGSVMAEVTWHTRRSRFELYARFCRDWYWLASPTSIGPLLQGYNRWLHFGALLHFLNKLQFYFINLLKYY
jgi:hypothetical protein